MGQKYYLKTFFRALEILDKIKLTQDVEIEKCVDLLSQKSKQVCSSEISRVLVNFLDSCFHEKFRFRSVKRTMWNFHIYE